MCIRRRKTVIALPVGIPQSMWARAWCLGLMLLMAICGAWLTLPLHAQSSYGSLVGTVTDTTGATLIDASVAITNVSTNATQRTTTRVGGGYSFVNLNPGTYSIKVTQANFKSATQNSVEVHIGGATRVDFALEVGNVSESVIVTGAANDLHTDSATLEGVIESKQVLDSPLNGRNVNNLLDFVPGVTPGGGTQGNTIANQSGGTTQAIAYGNYQIGGSFSGQSLFFIDGVGSNISENNVNTLVLTQDAVQEFRVSTNNVSAEFGGYGGGVIQISSKSGTNNFHGSAYEYLRNTALNAADWFSKYNWATSTSHEGMQEKSPLHQNQYGLNVGGPVFRNKLFFFYSWEHESVTTATPFTATVPTSAELEGDFSSDPQAIYDPSTGKQITKFTPNATALKIIKLETPDESRVTQTPYTSNFYSSKNIAAYQNQFNARLDATLNKDVVFARYTFWNPHDDAVDPYGTKTGGTGRTGNFTQEAVLGDTHTFTPSLVGDLRLSYIENYNFQYPLSKGYNMSEINDAYGTVQSESTGKEGALPCLSMTGYSIGSDCSELYWNNNVWAVNASLTKILGRHTIKLGGTWRQILWTSYGNINGGMSLSATSYFTAATASDTSSGNALASFLMNMPSQTSMENIGTQHAFQHNYGFFITDNYQMTPKLTVVAGLRWEQPGAYSEENDIDAVFLPNKSVAVGSLNSITNPVTGDSIALKGNFALVNSSDYKSRREESLHWKLFSPRLGFSYRYNPSTVIRSGYGISYFPADVTQDGPQLSPLGRSTTSTTNTPGSTMKATVEDPFPNGINQPAGHSTSGLTAEIGNGIWARVPDQAYGYSQQWNLALEHSFDANTTATVAYAGSKGTHLVMASANTGSSLSLNQIPNKYDSLGDKLLQEVDNPFYGTAAANSTGGSKKIAEGYLLMPYPQYPAGVLQQVPRRGNSTYHALQASFVRHLPNSGLVQVAYTWSKLLSDTDNTSSFLDGQGGSGVPQDNYNLHAEKSLSMQDIASNLVINYGIDLPFGRGHRILGSTNGITNRVVGDWHVSGITTFRSGMPVSLTAASNYLSQFGGGTPSFNLGAGIIRPNYATGCSTKVHSSTHSAAHANEWFNTSCFSQPDAYAFGSESRVDPSIRTDKQANFDLSLNKSFPLPAKTSLKFSGEIFDLFNHPQFGMPTTSVASSSFGKVTSQLNIPRTVQFALRYSF